VLRAARLVDTRRDGTRVYYRLADGRVAALVRDLQTLGRARLAEVERVASAYIDEPDTMEPIGLPELARRLENGDVTVIDVRPREEYAAGHIPGALSLPLQALERGDKALPRRREIVAYCRGPYCVYATQAVVLLRKRGHRARRLVEGLPGWRAAGHPVA
jgi:rhodanese-related sulfurtransferase